MMISTYALRKEALMDGNAAHSELYLVDGSGFIFRAYHALPPMTNTQGVPVNAVFGFSNMLAKLINDMNAPNIAVIFDAARKNFRNDIYAAYKANRSETPEDLIPQFPLIRAATEAFSLPALEMEGFEADDLIATYVRLAREQDRSVVIVSSDKDLMQLVGPGVRMFDPMKSKYLEEADVVEKFGVTPDKVVDVQALAGDSIDNVPGVPGIGIKTAAQLINEYGDLDGLLSRLDEIKQPKRRETLQQNAENARISRQLVRLDAHVKVDRSIESLRVSEPDTGKLIAFLQEQGFRSLQARVEKKAANAGGASPVAVKPSIAQGAPAVASAKPAASNAPGAYELVQDEAALLHWVAMAQDSGIVAVDTETTGLTPSMVDLVGISLSTAEGNGCYVPVGHRDPKGFFEGFDFSDAPKAPAADLRQIPLQRAIEILRPVLEDPSILKIGHNIKYDMQMFMQHGVRITPYDDTMLISYVLDGTSTGHGMDELAEKLLGYTTIKYEDVAGSGRNQVTFDLVPLDKACNYAAEDADVTLRLYNQLKPRLPREGMNTVYETMERPLAAVIADMEFTGVRVDPDFLRDLSNDFGRQILALETEIHKLAGQSFNIGSPKQMGEVLFGAMGLPGATKTKTGAWSTAANVLEDLAGQGHEIVDKILLWRGLSKLKSTYTDSLPLAISPRDHRVHTSFAMAWTSTGRLASSDPNLQNIPIKTEDGRKIREAFVPAAGYRLMSVDYSQVELRLAAEMAGIKALKQAFRDGIDIHAATASQVFGVPLEQMTSDIRRNAKAINFGIIYGISGFGLAKQLGIPQGEAANYIKQYLARFPELRDFMEDTKEYARKHGYVKTFYGRKCYIRGINDKMQGVRQGAERQAINAPLQGTAADIMKRAMIALGPALAEAKLGARMLIQVHDELLFEVPLDQQAETEALVKRVMESSASGIDVPLTVEAGWGESWAAAH